MRKPSGQSLFLGTIVTCSALLAGYLLLFDDNHGLAVGPKPVQPQSHLTLADIPFDGQRAHRYLEELCALGPRVSGTPGMKAQQELLTEHFEGLGATVKLQEFRVRHPQHGAGVPMANLIIQFHPERRERILLCAHYDTRPLPDRDRDNPQGIFVGANDGASGTALLMELAREMGDLKGKLGVDFVLFDGEELVFNDRDPYFLGSEFFAQQYRQAPGDVKYRCAVVLDMIGDADLQIFQERFSTSWRDSRPLVKSIWDTAQRLKVREFVHQKRHEIRDDHLALHTTAKIPCCDIIDFDYPHWHTTGDTPDKCSPLALAKVGWVMSTWLKEAVKGN